NYVMIKELAKFTNTFEGFKKYLFTEVYKGDKESFKRFPTLNDFIIVARAVEYLEYLKIPTVDAFNYYNYQYPNAKFLDKMKNLALKEFYRIEHNIKCDYTPF